MKVVGGAHDGQEVPDPIGRHMRLFELISTGTTYVPVTGPTIKEHIYTVRRFYFNRDDYYEFLAPNGWSDKQALFHQFSK